MKNIKDFIDNPVTESRRDTVATKTESDATAELQDYFYDEVDWDYQLYFLVMKMVEYQKKRIAGNDMMYVLKENGKPTSLWGTDERFLNYIAKKLQSATYEHDYWKKH